MITQRNEHEKIFEQVGPSDKTYFFRRGLGTLLTVASIILVGVSVAEARNCKSNAYEKSDAVEFCKKKLKSEVSCSGHVRRWICKKVKKKGVFVPRNHQILITPPDIVGE